VQNFNKALRIGYIS